MTKRATADAPSKRPRTPAPPTDAEAPTRIGGSLTWPLRVGALVLTVIGVLPLANVLTDGPGMAWYPAAVAMWLRWGGGLAAAVVLVAMLAPGGATRVARRVEQIVLAPSRYVFLGVVATVTCALALYFGWVLLGLEATAGDEFAQRWQAHLLTMGRLYARMEPQREFFNTTETLDVDGRWFSHFPVGGPAFLALGLALRAPWLVNPMLAAITACAVYHFVAATVDERSARWSSIYVALSPFVLFLSGSEMNHVATLAAVWTAAAALPRWTAARDARSRTLAAVIVGVSLGIAAAVRPYDAALATLAFGAFQLHAALREPSLRRSLAIQCLAGAVPVALLLAANWATTGAPLSFAYDVLNGPEHRPGFHATPLGFEHTPLRGLYAICAYLLKLDMMLLGWPVPAVLLPVVTLALLRRGNRWDVFQLSMLAAILAGYLAYWGESYFMGPRFMLTIAPVLLVYAARMPAVLGERLARPALAASATLVPLVWLTSSWVLPANVDRMFGVATLASTALLPRSAAPAVNRALSSPHLDRVLVLVPESWHGRLAARLRALDVPPLQAEEMVKAFDACTLQRALDAAPDAPPAVRIEGVWTAISRDQPAARLSGLSALDQIALVPGRPLDARCTRELERAPASGITLAELLSYQSLDSSGAPGGAVVYARDLGALNERLRPRFGDRRWLTFRLQGSGTSAQVEILPYAGVAPPTYPAPASRSAN